MIHINVKIFTIVILIVTFHNRHTSVLISPQHSYHLAQRCVKLSLHPCQSLALNLTYCLKRLDFSFHLLSVVSHFLFQNFLFNSLLHPSQRLSISLTLFLPVPELVVCCESPTWLSSSKWQRKKLLLSVVDG